MGPWMGGGELVRNQPGLREHYQTVKYKVDKYPYLYEGMKEINDFRKMYCPKDVLGTGNFLKCNNYDSIDDGRLLNRFEKFVNDYDGIEPFDVHLNMQVTNLIYGNTGEPLYLYHSVLCTMPMHRGYREGLARSGKTTWRHDIRW